MLQLSDLTIKTAVVNHDGVVETRDHFKNGASLKSLMSKGKQQLKYMEE